MASARTVSNYVDTLSTPKHSRIAKAIHERLLSVHKVFWVTKLRCVKHDFIHNLRDANRMCAWTLVVCERVVAGRICHVALMIWAVEVDAVPARGKDDSGTNATGARRVGELRCVIGIAGCATAARDAFICSEAPMTDTRGFSGLAAQNWISCEHSEALCELV
jgi:hypothetical protein